MATVRGIDYYTVLGVPRDADPKTLKRAFRDLARRYHPDLSREPDAQERFKEVAEAYAVLSDPAKRAEYDRHGTAGVGDEAVDDLLAGLDLGDLLGGAWGRGFGDGVFGGLFGRPERRGPVRGGDIEVELTVPLATVLTGGTASVTLRRPGRCPACGGIGAAPGSRPQTCDRCRGTGRVASERRRGGVVLQQVALCTACAGSGVNVDDLCGGCAGSGIADQSEQVTLRIPRGIAEGTSLRLPGRGMPGSTYGVDSAGDAYVVVHTAADPRFVRRGADLWHGEEIGVPDAVLGTTLTVPGLDGDLALTVPPGTQPGAVLRLAGRGLPHRSGHGRGDLHVTVTVRVPEHPGAEELALYRRLREPAAEPGPEPPERRRRPRWWRRNRSAEADPVRAG